MTVESIGSQGARAEATRNNEQRVQRREEEVQEERASQEEDQRAARAPEQSGQSLNEVA